MRHEACARACCLEKSCTTSTIPKTSSASHLDPQPGVPCGKLAIMQGSPGSSSRCAESIGVCGRGPVTSYSLGWNSDSSCQTRSPSSSRMIPGHSRQVAALLSPLKTPSRLACRRSKDTCAMSVFKRPECQLRRCSCHANGPPCSDLMPSVASWRRCRQKGGPTSPRGTVGMTRKRLEPAA